MSTITREQLRERAREKVKSLEFAVTQAAFADSRAELEEELELARIALASLEAEQRNDRVCDEELNAALRLHGLKVEGHSQLSDAFRAAFKYARRIATPSTIYVPGAVDYSDLDTTSKDREVIEAIAECKGWNACRAAMLQGAEPVSNRDELPLDYLQGHKDGLEWAAQLAEANHPHTGDWLYDDPIELAKAIRKGPDMPEADSNSPVIPGCSCRNCRPVTMTDMRFVVCPECGNKRCPHANDHQNACTGSNEPGQERSAYPAVPQQEEKP